MSGNQNQTNKNPNVLPPLDEADAFSPAEKTALTTVVEADDFDTAAKTTVKDYFENTENKVLNVIGGEEELTEAQSMKEVLDNADKSAENLLKKFPGTQNKTIRSDTNYRWYKDQNIALIQIYLCACDYPVKVDGILWPKTEWALKQYRKIDKSDEEGEIDQDKTYTFTVDQNNKRNDSNFDGLQTTVTIQWDGDLHIKNDKIGDIACQADNTNPCNYILTIWDSANRVSYDVKLDKDKNPVTLTFTKNEKDAKQHTVQLWKTEVSNNTTETNEKADQVSLWGKEFKVAYTEKDGTKTYTNISCDHNWTTLSWAINNNQTEFTVDDWKYNFDMTGFDGAKFADGKVTRSKWYAENDSIVITESNKTSSFEMQSATYSDIKIDKPISGDNYLFEDKDEKIKTEYMIKLKDNKSDYDVTLISETKWPYVEWDKTYSIIKKVNKHYIVFDPKTEIELTIDSKSSTATFQETIGSTTTTYTIDHFDYKNPEELLMRKKLDNNEKSITGLIYADKTYTKYQVYQDYRNQSAKVHVSDASTKPNTKDIIFIKNSSNTYDPVIDYDPKIVWDDQKLVADWFVTALTDDKKWTLVTDTLKSSLTITPTKSDLKNYQYSLDDQNNFTFSATQVYDIASDKQAWFGGLLTVTWSSPNQTLMFQWYTVDTNKNKVLVDQTIVLEKSKSTDLTIWDKTYTITLDASSKISSLTEKPTTA